jgi:hypothetical protein
MSDMKSCTETARRWPDAFGDVSPEDEEDFLAHAEGCAYHAAILHAAEAKIVPYLRGARALSGDGRLLLGEERERVAAQKKREAALWRAAAAKRERPFVRIALYNAGHLIASCGNFRNLIRQVATHRLELEAGIEIWGVVVKDGTLFKAQIGFYGLEELPHKGEETYPLENGYTVGLKVEEAEEELLKVELRCVENDVLERERAEAQEQAREKAQAAAATGGAAPAGGEVAPAGRPRATRAAKEAPHRDAKLWQGRPAPWQQVSRYAPAYLLPVFVIVAVIGVSLAAADGYSTANANTQTHMVEKELKPRRAEGHRGGGGTAEKSGGSSQVTKMEKKGTTSKTQTTAFTPPPPPVPSASPTISLETQEQKNAMGTAVKAYLTSGEMRLRRVNPKARQGSGGDGSSEQGTTPDAGGSGGGRPSVLPDFEAQRCRLEHPRGERVPPGHDCD